MIDIDAHQAPRAVADLARQAELLGWRTRITYGEGVRATRAGDQPVSSIALRMRRPGAQCHAVWDVTTGCRLFSAGAWLAGAQPRKVNLTQVRELLASPPL